jgi:hypothetical protein
MSWKSVQWKPSCSVQSDGQTDVTNLIVAFRNFAMAPKKTYSCPCPCHKGVGEVEVWLFSFLTSAQDGIGGQHHVPAALPPEKYPGTHCTGGCLTDKRPPTAVVALRRTSHVGWFIIRCLEVDKQKNGHSIIRTDYSVGPSLVGQVGKGTPYFRTSTNKCTWQIKIEYTS